MCQTETNQTKNNDNTSQESQFSVCMEIAAAESIDELNIDAPKVNDCK